jgi:hypothetical protein
MPQRSTSSGSYRYGFNGQEKSDDIKGSGNSYTAEFWEYDPRLGRRWNLDPVIKPWQSDYSTFSGNPIWRIDPKGDDDFFNADGSFSHRTKTGTTIKIITKDGIKLLSDVAPTTPANIKALVNVIGYYRPQTGIPNNVRLGISPNTPNKGEGENTSLAFKNRQGIMVSGKDGIAETLNNYNNLVNTLVHEKNHWLSGDQEKGDNYTFKDHISIYEKQIDDKSFAKTDDLYKIKIAVSYASYLLGALKVGEIDEKDFDNAVIGVNVKLKPYGIGIVPTWSSAALPAVNVIGKNSEGKKAKLKDWIEPKNKPQ